MKEKIVVVKCLDDEVDGEKRYSVVKDSFCVPRFRDRYRILMDLLEECQPDPANNEKEYVVYNVALVCHILHCRRRILRKHIMGAAGEPSWFYRRRFVWAFGVNREWIMFGIGKYPFQSNIKVGKSVFDLLDKDIGRIRRIGFRRIKGFIVVFGHYESKVCAFVIRILTKHRYELYPVGIDLEEPDLENVKRFYKFLKNAESRYNRLDFRKADDAAEFRFEDLVKGVCAPKIVLRYDKINLSVDQLFDCAKDSGLWPEFEEVKKRFHDKYPDSCRYRWE